MFQLLRGAKWLQNQMRAVERIRAARAAYDIYVNAAFNIGKSEEPGPYYAKLRLAYMNIANQGRMWGEDLDVMKDYINKLPKIATEGLNWMWKAANAATNSKLHLGNVGVNIPGLVLGSGIYTSLTTIGVTAVGALVPAVAAYGVLWALGKYIVGPIVGGKLKVSEGKFLDWSSSSLRFIKDKFYKFSPIQ